MESEFICHSLLNSNIQYLNTQVFSVIKNTVEVKLSLNEESNFHLFSLSR